MADFAASNGLSPTVALLSSDGVEEIAQRSNLSFADLLVPFNDVQISINDPSGQQSSLKLHVNFRDIKRNGYLLSFTVLPSVLKETIRICSQRNSGDDAWTNGFKEFFHYWLEGAVHDFLKSYVCCVFAVSTKDSDPMTILSSLIQQQNYQQHGSGESANSLSPAHCTSPKWFLPQTLKYYVLVQDVSKDDDERAQSIFASMNSTYGQQFCYHLKINSTEQSNMPDPWSNLLADRYRGLESGLELARREIMAKGGANPAAAAHELANLSISSIATVSSDITVSTLPMNMDGSAPKRPPPPVASNLLTGFKRGDCLDMNDRERISNFVEHFVKNSLVPFVEKQLVTQNEALMSRRGIGKSFTNMKKWLNVASVTPQTTPTNVNYANESPEMQTRRLADLAFLFGLYNYSHGLYQTLKKDFLNDQAWLHHAGALEMAALSSYLGSTAAQNLKSYPGRYMENAIEFYSNTCAQPLLAVRCVLYSAEILVQLEKYLEAANQIIRITSGLLDIYGGVFLERAANLFAKCKMFRRQAFHSVLAGHRYEQSDLMQMAFQCYNKALPEYIDKLWTNAEDNVLCVVSRDPSLKADDRIECSQRLVRAYCMNQSEEQQEVFLKNYLRQTTDENRQLIVPIVSDVGTFFGSDSTALNEEDLTQQNVAFTPDGMDMVPDPTWTDIERAAFLSLFGSSATFRPINSFATQATNNSGVNVTPVNEKFTVRLKLVNPLRIPLKLKQLQLDFTEVETSGGQPFAYISEINELELPGVSLIENGGLSSEVAYSTETHETQVDLFCVPTEVCRSFVVSALKFNIAVGDSTEVFKAHVPISVRGRRLFGKKHELTNVVYATDNRLKAHVSTQPHPLLNFQFTNSPIDQSLEVQTTYLNLFCSQTHVLNLQISNPSNCDIEQLCVAFDRSELVTFYDPQTGSQFQPKTNINCPGVFISLLRQSKPIAKKETINLQLISHASPFAVENSILRLVFFYVSTDGICRQWRHKIEITTMPLIWSEISVLDMEDKLCALKVRNEINSRDSILVQIECLRLEANLKTSSGLSVDLHPLSNRKIVLDTDQSDLFCFYVRFTRNAPHAIIMGEDRNVLHWPYLLDTQSDHLRFALTWRAKITRDTTTSIHGQSIISNPFIQFPQNELNLLTETATPNILVQTRLLRQLVPIEVGKEERLAFTLSPEECRRQADVECTNKSLPETIKIPWSIDM